MPAGIDTPLRLDAGGVSLAGHLSAPETPVRGAVVCHPHPRYGGDMDNDVVIGVGEALHAAGTAVLRFNFRGVGGSGGRHGGGRDEVQDVRAAVAHLVARFPGTPVTLVGYSFGAAVALQAGCRGLPGLRAMAVIAPPVSLVDLRSLRGCELPTHVLAGDQDPFCGREEIETIVAASPRVSLAWVAGADHFFAGAVPRLAALVREFIKGSDTGAEHV